MVKIDNMAVIGGIAVVVIGIFVFLKTTTGKAVGENVAGAVTGFAGGILGGVADAANSDANPLKPAGEWLSETIFDATHW